MAYLEEGGDGVSGLLGAFVVMIGIFTPFNIALSLWDMYRDPMRLFLTPGMWSNLQLLVWSVSIATVAICWYLCWLLNKRQVWRTVPITIGLYWLVVLANFTAALVGVAAVLGLPVAYIWATLGIFDFLPFAIAVAATLYFLLSKRVKLTYPRYPQADEMRQTFD